MCVMSKLMQQAIEVLPQLTKDDQEEVARFILAKADEPMPLSAAEKAAIQEGMADTQAGRFTPDGTIEELIARLRSAAG